MQRETFDVYHHIRFMLHLSSDTFPRDMKYGDPKKDLSQDFH